ncbi:MAG TPA: hydroxyacid-oxoacid transhydrogenase [Solirubrobacteraceae bacterium]|nr:hydroxyacid-oxoacid transhydrogenase [Solirubrobacteraceae bacterium]
MSREQVFTLEATPLKFGRGAADEAGWELERLGVRRALLVSDPGVVRAGITARVQSVVEAAGIDVSVWDQARVEPTDESFREAAEFARAGEFDGFVGVGGGSSIDTAKVADLIATHGGELMDYVNPPVGAGRAVPGPLRPLVAIPTTCGSGAEATSVAVLDVPELRVKTGISHRALRPDQALVDPSLTSTLPGEVVASCGLDVVCHAAESYVARPFAERERPSSPGERPPYQGATPVSEVWSARALEYGGRYLRAAVRGDAEARGWMMLAASLAGIGFGAAGVHVPHACAYPIAGLRHGIPHGRSVIVTAPAAFRFTYPADPARHRRVAELLAGRAFPDADSETLPSVLLDLMRDVGAPLSLSELGYGEGDIDDLVSGALKQQRLLSVAPRDVGAGDLAAVLRASL